MYSFLALSPVQIIKIVTQMKKYFSSLAQNLRGLVIFAISIYWPSLSKFQHLLHGDGEDDWEFMSSVNMHKQITKPWATPLGDDWTSSYNATAP